MNRRRAVTPRQLPAVLLLVVGIVLAVGAPTAWALTHRDPALTPVGAGIAVSLAESGTAFDSPSSATLDTVPTATTPTSPTATPGSSTGTAKSGTVTQKSTAVAQQPNTAEPGSRPGSPSPHVPWPSTAPKPSTPKSTVASKPMLAQVPVRAPARLRIPAIGVDAPVGPVGIDERGDMAVPEQVQDIGWYRFGPAPGATNGSAVLSGHVDSAQQGLGAFSRLGELQAGDAITVTDTSGRQLRYRVVGKEAFDKQTVPLADLFSRSGAARLTLITCGGPFDEAALSYVDNIVVTAVPA